MLQVWTVIGSVLAIVQFFGYAMVSLCSNVQSPDHKNKEEPGIWLTSKLADLSLCFVSYLVVSWGLSFGCDNGSMFAGASQFFLQDVIEESGGMSLVIYTFFLMSTSTLIVAEKVRFELEPLHLPYHILIMVASGVLFPIVLHWAWSDSGWASPWRSQDAKLLLFGCGTLDTGGSAVLHFSAGLVSLAFVMAMADKTESSLLACMLSLMQGGLSARVAAEGADSGGDDGKGSLEVVEMTAAVSAGGRGKDREYNNSGIDTEPERKHTYDDKEEKNYASESRIGSNKPLLKHESTLHSSTRMRLLREQERRVKAKDKQDGTIQKTVSVLLVWLGSYGTSLVSNLNGNTDTDTADESSVSRRMLNVTLALVFSFLTSIIFVSKCWNWFSGTEKKKAEITRAEEPQFNSNLNKYVSISDIKNRDDDKDHVKMNQFGTHIGCMLCSLVAIKAGAGVVEIEGAIITGILATIFCHFSHSLQDKWSSVSGVQSSTESAFTIHLIGGLLGALSVGFFASPDGYAESVTDAIGDGSRFYTEYNSIILSTVATSTDRAQMCSGIFYGGDGSTLMANIYFLLTLLTWCFSSIFLLTKFLKVVCPGEFTSLRQAFLMNKIMSLHAERNNDQPVHADSSKFSTAAGVLHKIHQFNLNEMSDAEVLHTMETEEDRFGALCVAEENEAVENSLDISRGDGIRAMYTSLKHQLTTSKAIYKTDGGMHCKTFKEEFGYSWDAVLVFPIHNEIMPKKMRENLEKFNAKESGVKPDPGFTPPITCKDNLPSAKRIVKVLRDAGCETSQHYSLHEDKIICKIRVPLLVLRRYADLMDKPFLLNEQVLQEKCEKGFTGRVDGKPVHIAPFSIYDGFEEGVTTLKPYQYIYGNWDMNTDPTLYQNAEGYQHEFGSLQRLSIIKDLVRGAVDEAPDMENFDELGEALLAWFPIRDEQKIKQLFDTVFSFGVMPGKEPHCAVRDYFGEEIALYFKFLLHYVKWLFPVALLGLVLTCYMGYLGFQGYSYYEVLNRNTVVPIFAVAMCTWTNSMLKYWADHEKLYALRWGTTEFEETERELPSYKGFLKTSYITGKPMKVVDIKKQNSRRRVSTLVIVSFSLLVLGIFALTFMWKFWLYSHNLNNLSMVADIVNGISIFILDMMYRKIALRMTSFENCRTQTEFNDSLITKLFVFGFCNFYSSLIYIAFFKKIFGDPCLQDSCMGELGQTLTVIFVLKSSASHVMTWLVPKISMCISRFTSGDTVHVETSESEVDTKKKEGNAMLRLQENLARRKAKLVVKKMGVLELEYLKGSYEDVFTDYYEICIQFGFLTMFVTAFPLSPFLAMVSNFVEDRVDGGKLLYSFRRPWPNSAEDIGSWYDIFQVLSVIAIFFNAAIVTYTMDLYDDMTVNERYIVYFLFVMLCFLCRYLAEIYSTTSHSKEVEIQLRRQKHLVRKVIERVPDELDYDSASLNHVTSPEYYFFNENHKVFSNSEVFEVSPEDDTEEAGDVQE